MKADQNGGMNPYGRVQPGNKRGQPRPVSVNGPFSRSQPSTHSPFLNDRHYAPPYTAPFDNSETHTTDPSLPTASTDSAYWSDSLSVQQTPLAPLTQYYPYFQQPFPHIQFPPAISEDMTSNTPDNINGVRNHIGFAQPMPIPQQNVLQGNEAEARSRPRKRVRVSNVQETVDTSELLQRSKKVSKAHSVSVRHQQPNHSVPGNPVPIIDTLQNFQGHNAHQPNLIATYDAKSIAITKKQKKFIRNWYKNHATVQGNQFLTREDVSALATLLRIPVHTVVEWMNRKIFNQMSTATASGTNVHGPSLLTEGPRLPSDAGYSLRQANSHLAADVLDQVDKYVTACQRRRTPTDGRRKVNAGRYKCTFGCGYRTSRVYDWKRHEETHQPQNLWLCHICRQSGNHAPFLVNRNDKFLKHAKDVHGDMKPDEVLEISKVDFRADFNAKCHLCAEVFSSWDDKCQHVIYHYDTAAELEARAPPPNDDSSEGDDSDSSSPDAADSSDDEDDEDGQGGFGKCSNRRDATGGSGGGSGNLGGFVPSNESHVGNNSTLVRGQLTYNSCYDSTYAASSERATSPPKDHKKGSERMTEKALSSGREAQLWSSQKGQTLSRPTLISDNVIIHRQQPSFNHGTLLFETQLQQFKQASDRSGVSSLTVLGHGAHGSVDTVQQYVTGKVYARKRTSHISSFQKEVEILKMVDHPHIIKYITAYHQNASLNLIMSPVAQSTVKEYLASSGPIRNDFSRIQKWICCLSSALSHIHSRKIRHADIKPSNILIRDEDIFISDFGISRIVSEPDSTSSSISPSTPFYAAIEIATRQRHGRKADVFSFGCVVVELLTVAHGKSVAELHRHLGLSKTKLRSRDGPAYWKANDKLLSWIYMLKTEASSSTQRLWAICERMLQNTPDLRPSSPLLFEEVRQAIETRGELPCPECMIGLSRSSPVSLSSSEPNIPTEPSNNAVNRISRRRDTYYLKDHHLLGHCNETPAGFLPPANSSKVKEIDDSEPTTAESCPTPTTPQLAITGSRCSCACTRRKKRDSLRAELVPILLEYEKRANDPDSFYVPDLIAYSLPLPAYEELPSGSITSVVLDPLYSWTRGASHANWIMVNEDTDGKSGIEFLQLRPTNESRDARAPIYSQQTQYTCHICGTQFAAPRLVERLNCTNIRCEQCTAPPNTRCQVWPRKADLELAGLGTHLLPPAYSLHDKHYKPHASLQPHVQFTGVESEQAVWELVIAQSQSHGDDPVQRFILEAPSTFDRIQLPVDTYNSEWLHQSPSTPSIVDDADQLDISLSIPPEGHSIKRLKVNSEQYVIPQGSPSLQANRRQSHRKDRQFISSRSKQSICINRKKSPMSCPTITPRLLETREQQFPSRLPKHSDPISACHGAAANPQGTTFTSTPGMLSKTRSASSNRSSSTSIGSDSLPPHRSSYEEQQRVTGVRLNGPEGQSGFHPAPKSSHSRSFSHTFAFPAHRSSLFPRGMSSSLPSPGLHPASRKGKDKEIAHCNSGHINYSPPHHYQPQRNSADSHRASTFPLTSASASGESGFASGPGSWSRSGSGHNRSDSFQQYGRHANSWLFNDISIRVGVKRGLAKVFHHGGKGVGEGSGDESGKE